MGSGGTEWETGDIFDPIRMNQKSRFIGTGQQATNLITSPQVGQSVYSLEDDATFKKDKIIIRNSTNTNWITSDITEITDYLGSLDTAGGASGVNFRWYDFFTLPTTEKFYIITELQVRVLGGSPQGSRISVVMGVDLVNANPPTLDHTPLIAIGRKQTNTSNDSEILIFPIHSKPIKGGSIIGVWANYTQAVGGGGAPGFLYGSTNTTVYRKSETQTESPGTANNTAFGTTTAGTSKFKFKYYGYS